MPSYKMSLHVGASLEYRDFVLQSVFAACRMVGTRQKGLTLGEMNLKRPFDAEFISAFSEIFNNIVMHGHPNATHKTINITIDVKDELLSTHIKESGNELDPRLLTPPELPEYPERGMGFHIVRGFLDSFEYRPGPPNHWKFSKRFKLEKSNPR